MAKVRATHTGSLPRPKALEDALIARENGETTDGLPTLVTQSILTTVETQNRIGLDVINDGEMGRAGYSTYVKDRLTGFDGSETSPPLPFRDLQDFPDFAEKRRLERGPAPVPPDPACTGPVSMRDRDAVQRDLANLLTAADSLGVDRSQLFMTAASPGVIAVFLENLYYPDHESYLAALVDAMRSDYQAIIDAGITLQLDCPDVALSRNSRFADLTIEEFRRQVALSVEAVNEATKGLPPERIRIHVCWGNREAPHTYDVALGDILDLVLQVNALGLSIEACNPRHAHEWEVFKDVRLPDGKYLIPGVIDTTTNFVEHPRLVAQRLDRYVSLFGADRVVAGTDCGFATFVGRTRVVQDVAWAKLAVMVEGVRLINGENGRES
jgi:5-methyltetrahydropteroyltriglutamate--homocysteine methyltransferase